MKFAYFKRLRLLLTPCSGTADALMGLIKAEIIQIFYLLCLSVSKNRSILVLSSGSHHTKVRSLSLAELHLAAAVVGEEVD